MNPEEIGYSGQYLNNTQYRIKDRTGPLENLYTKAPKDAVLGELFLGVSGVNGADSELHICVNGTSDSDATFKKIKFEQGALQ